MKIQYAGLHYINVCTYILLCICMYIFICIQTIIVITIIHADNSIILSSTPSLSLPTVGVVHTGMLK